MFLLHRMTGLALTFYLFVHLVTLGAVIADCDAGVLRRGDQPFGFIEALVSEALEPACQVFVECGSHSHEVPLRLVRLDSAGDGVSVVGALFQRNAVVFQIVNGGGQRSIEVDGSAGIGHNGHSEAKLGGIHG